MPSGGGGPVQKWEVWRQTGSGGWIKLGEVLPSVQALTNSGLALGHDLFLQGPRGQHGVAGPILERHQRNHDVTSADTTAANTSAYAHSRVF